VKRRRGDDIVERASNPSAWRITPHRRPTCSRGQGHAMCEVGRLHPAACRDSIILATLFFSARSPRSALSRSASLAKSARRLEPAKAISASGTLVGAIGCFGCGFCGLGRGLRGFGTGASYGTADRSGNQRRTPTWACPRIGYSASWASARHEGD
jgi:hypothetical protein